MPWVISLSSATVVNLSLLTSDLYTLMFGLFLFGYKVGAIITVFIVLLSLDPLLRYSPPPNAYGKGALLQQCACIVMWMNSRSRARVAMSAFSFCVQYQRWTSAINLRKPSFSAQLLHRHSHRQRHTLKGSSPVSPPGSFIVRKDRGS